VLQGRRETSYFGGAKRRSNTGKKALNTQSTTTTDCACKCSINLVLHSSGVTPPIVGSFYILVLECWAETCLEDPIGEPLTVSLHYQTKITCEEISRKDSFLFQNIGAI